MATHRYILSMGHMNTDGGGAYREQEWTPTVTRKFRDAIIRRGGKAWIIQEEDGDRDPNRSIGRGLQNVAALCVDLARVIDGADAYISMHYEGVGNPAVRGFFGIYPDSPYGGVDVLANNPLDYNLCKVLAKHVEKTGMPKRTGWVVEPGVMSERQTGVGGMGYRLGEFVGTFGFRDTTARVILEGGAYTNADDRKLLWDDNWQNRYVEALVDGLEEVFGKFTGGKPAPAPVPDPGHKPTYAKPMIVREAAENRPFVALDNKSIMVRADLEVRAIRKTPRLQYASSTSAHVGAMIPAGATFTVDYLIVNPDQSLYWYTRWGTRVVYEDTEIIGEE